MSDKSSDEFPVLTLKRDIDFKIEIQIQKKL